MCQTKETALQILDGYIEYFQECIIFSNTLNQPFYVLCKKQIQAMKNSINHTVDFYYTYFHNKTEEEIQQWIEKEAKKW